MEWWSSAWVECVCVCVCNLYVGIFALSIDGGSRMEVAEREERRGEEKRGEETRQNERSDE